MLSKTTLASAYFLCASLCLQNSEASTTPQNDKHYAELDTMLLGKKNKVEVPFAYLETTNKHTLDMIYQGGYKIYDIKSQEDRVAVLPFLCPCVGAAITDEKTLLVIHIHSTNSLEAMHKLIKKQLDLSDHTKISARLFSAKDEWAWYRQKISGVYQTETEAKIRIEKTGSGEFDQSEVVRKVKDALEDINIPRAQCPASLYTVRRRNGEAPNNLCYFSSALVSVAVRLDTLFEWKIDPKKNVPVKHLKFWSFAPDAENVYKLDGDTYANPVMLEQNSALYTERKDAHYQRFFHKTLKEVMGTADYNTLDFFPVDDSEEK